MAKSAVFEAEWSVEDFNKDAESQFEKKVYVDNGTYEAVVSSSELGTSKAGNPKWVLEFSIKGGKFSGEKLDKHVPLTGKGTGIARQTLLAFHDRDDLTGKFKLLAEDYIGEKVIIVTEQKPYTNEYGEQIGVDVKRVLRADDDAARAEAAKTE